MVTIDYITIDIQYGLTYSSKVEGFQIVSRKIYVGAYILT